MGLAGLMGHPEAGAWQRPDPGPQGNRRDAVGAMLLTSAALLNLALSESFYGVTEGSQRWWGYAVILAIGLPLIFRRRWPILVMTISTVAFMVGSYINILSTLALATQVVYFASIYAAVAWSRSREAAGIAVVALGLVITAWGTIDLAVASSFRDIAENFDAGDGPFDPLSGYILLMVLVNLAFFGGAVYAGRASWRAAWRREQIQRQSVKIAEQADALAHRAVVDERLRIARELHDVVAHHVSAIGIQAGAARKMLHQNAEAAEQAMRTVEASSRHAVTETRQLLGVLREDGPEHTAFTAHGAEDLQDLVRQYADMGLSVTLTLAIESQDLADLPPGLGLSLYRCVQESLANVVRHSTGRQVSVVVRSLEAHDPSQEARQVSPGASRILELEVLDNGRPRGGTSGSGYGLVGIRERAQIHGASCDIGPRTPGPGWRVRIDFPLVRYSSDVDRGSSAGQMKVTGQAEVAG